MHQKKNAPHSLDISIKKALIILFFLYIFSAVLGLFMFRNSIDTAKKTMWVVDSLIHSESVIRHYRHRPVTDAIIAFHDENQKYHQFRVNSYSQPEGTVVSVIYHTSKDGSVKPALLSNSELTFFFLVLASLFPLIFFVYIADREHRATTSYRVTRWNEWIIFTTVWILVVFVTAYLILIAQTDTLSAGILGVIGIISLRWLVDPVSSTLTKIMRTKK